VLEKGILPYTFQPMKPNSHPAESPLAAYAKLAGLDDSGVMRELQDGSLYSEASQECARFVREALALLNEQQRRAIEIVHFEGLNLKDLATPTSHNPP
jgi:DNA-directed RNA polymerase specialized sigma24 family protein